MDLVKGYTHYDKERRDPGVRFADHEFIKQTQKDLKMYNRKFNNVLKADAIKKIQAAVRGFLSRRQIEFLRK